GGGTGGSRSLPVGGAALADAVENALAKARAQAARMLGANEAALTFSEGTFTLAGTNRFVSLSELAAEAARHGETLGAAGAFKPSAATFPNGCHVCEVEIDPETGAVVIVGYTIVDDFGVVLNPLLLAGQVYGGVAQGIGQALLEKVVYDPESGQLLSGSLMDYGLPRAADMPSFRFAANEVPCRANPLGVKGAGEAGAIGAPPAVINAIVDALAPLGIRHIDMPATPHAVWRALRQAQAGEPL
ncbi:MAG: molybdopterin-dependent oxidoreductase, partial [Rhodospirillales bacterium]|nr:molybdopterin-dependent oxidoreductase [Rhodospirillales bacterium]